jgi:hypothetical protein
MMRLSNLDQSSPRRPDSVADNRATDSELETFPISDRNPSHGNRYEKHGVRANGDHFDHEDGSGKTPKRAMSFVAMAFLFTASQIPCYLFGGIPPYIYREIGGDDRWIWFILANLLALAAVCPFVGSLSDLIGRRYVAMLGASFIILGMVVCSTAQTMNTFICMINWIVHHDRYSAN